MTRARIGRTVWVVIATLVCGCAASTNKYHDSNMDFGSIKTVAVLPFINLSRDNTGAERVRDVFANMLLATGTIYVLPNGEVIRGVNRIGIQNPMSPSAEEVMKLGGLLKCDAVIGGTVREYGEIRSGSAVSNVVSASVHMFEVASGKVVWSASSTRGGITMSDRMFGGGGSPVNDVTEQVVNELLDKLFKQ